MLLFNDVFFIRLQPQIIDSLLAKRTFLLNFVIIIVGSRPLIPGIAEIVISDFFNLILLKLL